MYICGSCRGAAVTITETGLIGVWQWAPLNDFFVHVFACVGGGRRYLYDMGKFNFFSFITEYLCMIYVGDLFTFELLINLL